MNPRKTSIEFLQDLIRIDTQNPPGNELAAALYIKEHADCLKLDSQLFTYDGNRGNIVIHLGPQTKDDLILLGHLDTVIAERSDWKYDPLEGKIVDGVMYGRGALDMKYFIACAMALMEELSQQVSTFSRGITFIFTSDEERGSSSGLEMLLEEEGMRERLSNRIVLNEGGGFALYDQSGQCHYLYETGQKSVCRLRVKVRQSGTFNPYFPDLSHDRHLIEAVRRIQNLNVDSVHSATATSLSAIFGSCTDEATKRLIETMSRSIMTATLIHGGARNPELETGVRASADFDCRLLPDVEKDSFLRKVEQALEDLPVEISLLKFSKGYESFPDENFKEKMLQSLQKADPSIVSLLPFVTPGSNDGKFLKPLGCDIFGFAPLVKTEPFTHILPLIHGIDERISLDSIAFCHDVIGELVSGYLKGETHDQQ
ncbi:MAG: M20/M25/M40 family metallo-hydrolase [Sphaerochaetaceae bacterium]|nr:M20/M25/M40 family metallo-hydrolase [Sphaerochaetaceae bacterium]